jgi:hypothetical protein
MDVYVPPSAEIVFGRLMASFEKKFGCAPTREFIDTFLEIGQAIAWIEWRAHDFDTREPLPTGFLLPSSGAAEESVSDEPVRAAPDPKQLRELFESLDDRKRYLRLRHLMPGLSDGGAPRLVPDFLRGEYIPAFNKSAKSFKACSDCGLDFWPSRRDRRFCSLKCSARHRNRRRQKVGNGRSAAENATLRQLKRAERHRARCAACAARQLCPIASELWMAASNIDALSTSRKRKALTESM